MLPSSRPQPSRSFRPTRLSAAFTCLTSSPSPFFSPFPPSLSSTAGTQSVIPAHSVLDCPPPSPPSSHLSPSLLPSFRPTRSLASCPWLIFSPSSSLSCTALTQSVIPAHSVSGNLISPSFFCLSLFFFTLAYTQSVIPAHSVTGYLLPLVLFPFHWTPFSQSHHPVGHSGPLGYWLHLGLSSSFWLFSLSTSYSAPSLPCRSFRPTRQLTSSSP